jgi:hypothetical protein
MIPGVRIAMGGNDWVVPPLTVGQLRRLLPKVQTLSEVGAAMGEEQIATLLDIVATALQRNYPDRTPERVADLLDLGNARDVVAAILTGSGLKPAGEAAAVAGSNGATFTVSSPPPAATATRLSMR